MCRPGRSGLWNRSTGSGGERGLQPGFAPLGLRAGHCGPAFLHLLSGLLGDEEDLSPEWRGRERLAAGLQLYLPLCSCCAHNASLTPSYPQDAQATACSCEG